MRFWEPFSDTDEPLTEDRIPIHSTFVAHFQRLVLAHIKPWQFETTLYHIMGRFFEPITISEKATFLFNLYKLGLMPAYENAAYAAVHDYLRNSITERCEGKWKASQKGDLQALKLYICEENSRGAFVQGLRLLSQGATLWQLFSSTVSSPSFTIYPSPVANFLPDLANDDKIFRNFGKETLAILEGLFAREGAAFTVHELNKTGMSIPVSAKGVAERKKAADPAYWIIYRAEMAKWVNKIMDSLGELRVKEAFDIIREYPGTEPAVEDLNKCVARGYNLRAKLISSLRLSNATRLLHPGVKTEDIIRIYVITVSVLRKIDPLEVLLHKIAQPIRDYLKTREDTIRCIVSKLIAPPDQTTPIIVAAEDMLPLQEADEDEAENYGDSNWNPPPMDAPQDFHKKRGTDMLSLLVSIYETKDVFVKELQNSLGVRLLDIKDYNLDREVQTLEILKRRFGEQALQGCDVMIKDLERTKRTNALIHEQGDRDSPLRPKIISRTCWPAFGPTKFKTTGQLQALQTSYSDTYTRLRPDKKLKWLNNVGTTDVELEMDDGRVLTFEGVSIIQASVIEGFQEKETWDLVELSQRFGLSEREQNDIRAIRSALLSWVNKGVLRELDDGRWMLIEKAEDVQQQAMSTLLSHLLIVLYSLCIAVVEPEEQSDTMISAPSFDEFNTYWQYIKAMLGNLGAQPIGNIHSMLTKFVPVFAGKTQDELEAFLKWKMANGGEVEGTAGVWKLVNPS
ncbi:hypothetical protein BT69DRAFT_1260970 [Atractiella rhizophila]|nr:hypothetical protein BT69DRAFT_1260970 [Atractiella rhizophila]